MTSAASRLDPFEPNLSVALSADHTGGVAVSVQITPDTLRQEHRFSFALDQSYLPEFLAQGRRLLNRFVLKVVR